MRISKKYTSYLGTILNLKNSLEDPFNPYKCEHNSLLFQWSLAARVVRDAPEAPKAEGTDPNAFNINEALSSLSQGIQKAFSKENVDVSSCADIMIVKKSNFHIKLIICCLFVFRNLWKIWVRLERN